MSIPSLRLASAGSALSRLEAEISRGNVEVKTLHLEGGDVTLDADGKVYGARRIENYRFNLKGSFRVSPELVTKFPALGFIDNQKTPEGLYPFTMTGRVSKPNIRVGELKLPI